MTLGEVASKQGRQRWAPWIARTLRLAAALLVIATILTFGLRQAGEKIDKTRSNDFIGHSDEASYALQAKSILNGQGIRVNYITYFFHAYPPDITHREDNWPAFLGYAIAPCFQFLGGDAWVARLPGILIASIFLPLATALLTWAVCRRGYAALIAALVMMAAPQVYGQSMRVLADGATAMMVAATCACILLAGRQKRPWLYLFAGLFIAGGCFAKGSELLLLALYPVLAVMTHPKRLRILASPWLYAGLAVTLLFLAPFCYANLRDYGHPLHSTQRYVSSFFGIEPTANWDKAMYFPYWDGQGAPLPQISDRWNKHPDYRHRSREQFFIALQYVLAGGSGSGDISSDFGQRGIQLRDYLEDKPPPTPAETQAAARRARNRKLPPPPTTIKPVSEWIAPIWEIAGFMALTLIAAAIVWPLLRTIAAPVRWTWRKIRNTGATGLRGGGSSQTRASVGWPSRVLALALVAAVHAVFLAYFWRVDSRFCFPILPLFLSLGCTLGVAILEGPFITLWRSIAALVRLAKLQTLLNLMQRLAEILRLWPATATLLAAIILLLSQQRLFALEKKILDREGARPPNSATVENRYITTGRWISANQPDAIIMCRNPWELLFYCSPRNKAVALPYPDDDDPQAAEKIFAIARYYHVTHMLTDVVRPCMLPYTTGRKPGLTKIENAPRDLYEIDWTTAPTATVNDVFKRNNESIPPSAANTPPRKPPAPPG